MQCAARACGTAIYADDQRVVVADVGGNGLAVASFVTALLAVISGVTGVALFFTESRSFGAVLVMVGLLAGCGCWLSNILRARRLGRPLADLPVYFTLDRAAQKVLDPDGRAVCAIGAAKLELAFQATSSARALVLVTPHGRWVIARGNPFAGSTDDLVQVLVAAGVVGP